MTEASEREKVAEREASGASPASDTEGSPEDGPIGSETDSREDVGDSPSADGANAIIDGGAPASDTEHPAREAISKVPTPEKHSLPENVVRAARAFAMGGRALDPNEPTPPDPALARVLYAEAAMNAIRALLGDARVALEPGLDALTSRGELARILGRRKASAASFAVLLSEVTPSLAAMRDIEPSVAKLVEAAHGRRSLVLGERLRLAAVALAVVALVVATGIFFAKQPPWKQYRYKTSTTQAGYTAEGTLGSVGMSGLIFHTQDELAPWVEIDLGKVQKISRVTLTQREDCCQERGIPLLLQVAGEDKKWIDVGRKKEKFDVWEARFRARKARYVRLSSSAKTILHYADVKIQ